MAEPIIVPGLQLQAEGRQKLAASGQSFEIYEWSGSGPDYLHVHLSDDEAWYILEGTLTFRFVDRKLMLRQGQLCSCPPESLIPILRPKGRHVTLSL